VKVVHNATGKLHEVDEQTAKQGLQSGEFALQKGQAVDVIDSTTGDLKKVSADALGAEFQRGNELASAEFARKRTLEEKHKGLGDFALGVGEGLASGATFGLSDLAIAKSSEEARINAAERAELRPGVRMGSEIVGAAAPMLLSGGAGALGKAARFAPTSLVGEAGSLAARGASAVVGEGATSLLGRVAQRAIPMAAQGAVEGAAYGAGQVVSENALGGHEITAEKLLAGAEHGMFLGGAVGGGLGAVTELGKAAAQKAFKFAGEGSLKTWLQDVADNQTIRALGGSPKNLARNAEHAETRIAEVAETVRNAVLEDGTKVFKPFSNATELAEKLQIAEKQTSKRLASTVDEIEKITLANPEARPNIERFLKNVDDEFLTQMKASAEPEVRRRADRIEQSLERFRPKPVEVPQTSLDVSASENSLFGIKTWKKDDIGELLAGGRLQLPKISVPELPPPPQSLTFKELRQARIDLDSAIYQERASAASGIPGLPNPKLEAMERTRNLLEKEIETSADKAAALTGNEQLAGRYHADKREFRDIRQAKEMAEQWQMRDLTNRSRSPSDYAAGIGSGIAAAAGGLGGIASFGTGMLASTAHNLIRERGSSALAYAAERLANVNALSHVAAGVDQKIEAGVKAALRTELPRAVVQLADSPRQKAFTKLADKVAAINSDPLKASELVAQKVGGLANHAPGLAAAASTVIADDMKYVAERMPKRVSDNGLSAGARRVSTAEIVKSERMIRAIDRPLTVLKDMKAERLTPSVAQAIRDRRPEIMKQIEMQVATQIASGKLPSIASQKQLGILLGKPVSFQQSPQFKASIQQIYQQQQQQGPGGAPAPKQSRRPATKLASNQLTYSQKLE
jgi:hypothetical protein